MAVDTSGLIQEIQDFAAQVRDVAIDAVLEECRAAAPVSTQDLLRPERVPGALRDSLLIGEIEDTATIFSGAIESNLPYAQYTDDVDAGPHQIIARSSRSLMFWWDNGPAELGGPGIYWFAHVTHPGTQGKHWFTEPMPDRWERACEAAAAQI